MEELTESARQYLVSQGIVLGALSIFNSLGLLLTGIVVITRANDILHFTTLTYLAILEIVCGVSSLIVVAYICWIIASYRNRQLEIRSKYLDESMSRGLVALIFPLSLTFSAFVVSAIFMLLKAESSSTYDLKTAMTMYSTEITKKLVVDKLQILFQCCGSQSLLDWFLIDWQNSEVEPGEHLENNTDWDSVPFSCCCPEASPPCIHHQLRIFGVGSLYTEGCADKLDEAVFTFVLIALIMFFVSAFLMTFMFYSSRKLQTSARSAIEKGDATAPGYWWFMTPTKKSILCSTSDRTPLLDVKNKNRDTRRKGTPTTTADYCCKKNRIVLSSLPVTQKSKTTYDRQYNFGDSTVHDEWESYKTRSKNHDDDSSEDWTRRACDASGSTSVTSFLTTSLPFNSTPESRRSVSDTAVANLEVLHHFEHKVRPLYRS